MKFSVKRAVLLAFCISQISKVPAQKLTDTLFNNVIPVTKKDIISNQKDILITVPVHDSVKCPILYITDPVVSPEIFASAFPNKKEFIIMTPNFAYLSKVQNARQGEDAHPPKPQPDLIIFKFERMIYGYYNLNFNVASKDSIVLFGKLPVLNFAKTDTLKNNETDIYFIENYGSSCCPRDYIWDNKPSMSEFIRSFENNRYAEKVSIGDIYTRYYGLEGEHTVFYTLNKLADINKLDFIKDREFFLIPNRENKDMVIPSKIYIPVRMDKTKFIKL